MAVSSRHSHVLVVEPTDLFEFDDSAFVRKLDRSPIWRILTQGKVRSHFVVIIDIPSQNSLQVSGPKNDDMIQALSPNGTNDAFGVRVLPRRTTSGKNLLNAKSLSSLRELLSVNHIAIVEQVLRLLVHATSLNQLLRGPCSGRMLGYIDMQYPATVVAEDDKNKKTLKPAVGNVRKSSEMSSLE